LKRKSTSRDRSTALLRQARGAPGKYYLGGRDWRNRCPLTRDVKSARQPRRGAVGGTISANCFRCFGKKNSFFRWFAPGEKKRCDLWGNTKRRTISKQNGIVLR